MKSRVAVRVRAPMNIIFALAADVERWPERLPHYRYVRRLFDPSGERRFAMGARRGVVPVRWEAIQRPRPRERAIDFVHTGGVTRGMQVAWRFRQDGDEVEVAIEHRLHLRWPLIGELGARTIIGPLFIEAIARLTLDRIRELAEAGQPARPSVEVQA